MEEEEFRVGDRASFDLGGGVGLANQNISISYDFLIPFSHENTKSCFAIQGSELQI